MSVAWSLLSPRALASAAAVVGLVDDGAGVGPQRGLGDGERQLEAVAVEDGTARRGQGHVRQPLALALGGQAVLVDRLEQRHAARRRRPSSAGTHEEQHEQAAPRTARLPHRRRRAPCGAVGPNGAWSGAAAVQRRALIGRGARRSASTAAQPDVVSAVGACRLGRRAAPLGERDSKHVGQ